MSRLCGALLAPLYLSIPVMSHASCMDFSGSVDKPRHASLSGEYASSKFVILGRATHSRNISSPDDPAGYDWTVYDVEVLTVYKGRPSRSIKLVSPNTTSRFSMDEGKDYLLFIEHSTMKEYAGKELLPNDFVDNCGNSGPASEKAVEIQGVRGFADRKTDQR